MFSSNRCTQNKIKVYLRKRIGEKYFIALKLQVYDRVCVGGSDTTGFGLVSYAR